jgi:hypothetical protein
MGANYQTFIDNIDNAILNGNLDTDSKAAIVARLNSALSLLPSQKSEQFIAMNALKTRVQNAPLVNLKLRRAKLENNSVDDKLSAAYRALMANEEIDLVDISGLPEANDRAAMSYLVMVKAAALNNKTLTNSTKSVTQVLVPTTSIAGVLANASITDNDAHKPNELPSITDAYVNMTK